MRVLTLVLVMMVLVLMLMLVVVFMFMLVMSMPLLAMVMMMMLVPVLVLLVRMRRALVDAEGHALHVQPLLPLEMHVKIADLQFGELPLEEGRLDAEIAERADGHVAADAGKTIEEENFHGQ